MAIEANGVPKVSQCIKSRLLLSGLACRSLIEPQRYLSHLWQLRKSAATMASAFRWYQRQLAIKPMLTQSITTAVLFATGDTMAQQLVERKGFANHELGRTGRMALYGGAVFGPAATTWFGFLQRRIRIPSSPNLEILARVGADQTIFASTNLFVFLSSMAIMEGSDPKQKLESTYFNALQKNWMVWPVVQFTNFKFVPLEHRVLVVNVISLGWNCYLSYLNSQPSGEHIKNPTYPPDA